MLCQSICKLAEKSSAKTIVAVYGAYSGRCKHTAYPHCLLGDHNLTSHTGSLKACHSTGSTTAYDKNVVRVFITRNEPHYNEENTK